ncbi:MAG: hypothetical protein U9O55_02810 [Patescibacteria group bacterium]|nr:hypothetical protein [Patescibacteria group bacterium]
MKIPTINEHLKNIYKAKELEEKITIRKFLIVQIYQSDFDKEVRRILKKRKK